MPDSPLKRGFSMLRGGSERSQSNSPKGLQVLDMNAAATSPATASAEDVYRLGLELNELRKELNRERTAKAELQAQVQRNSQGSNHSGHSRNRRPSTRSNSSLRHSTASSASSASAITPDDDHSMYMSSSAALPRSKANLSLSQSPNLPHMSDLSGQIDPNQLANHPHGASLSKIPKFAVGMNRTLTGTNYDVSRSRSPMPEDYGEQRRSMTLPEEVEQDQDVFVVPALPDPQTTPSRRNSVRPPSSASRRRSIIPVSVNSPAPLNTSQSSSSGSHRSMNSSQNSGKTAISPNLPFSAIMTPSTSVSSAFSGGGGGGRGKGGIFFGSSDQVGARHAARVQSAASGTGKVLSELQVDLATVRGALETTKNQLRVASRANEHLSHQVSIAIESRETLRTQNDALDNILKRNQRILEATLERATNAEGQLERDKEMMAEQSARCFDLSERCNTAEERATRAEQAYEVLKGSISALGKAVRTDVARLKQEMATMEERHAQELRSALQGQQALSISLKEHAKASSSAADAKTELEQAHEAALKEVAKQLSEISAHATTQETQCREATAQTADVASEMARIRRLIREQSQ